MTLQSRKQHCGYIYITSCETLLVTTVVHLQKWHFKFLVL
uniref:Uncharacterized protein n=1 Tax=Anguilla anguilla TaxID=7936 RepID=A0A0E9UHU3_ANGAN